MSEKTIRQGRRKGKQLRSAGVLHLKRIWQPGHRMLCPGRNTGWSTILSIRQVSGQRVPPKQNPGVLSLKQAPEKPIRTKTGKAEGSWVYSAVSGHCAGNTLVSRCAACTGKPSFRRALPSPGKLSFRGALPSRETGAPRNSMNPVNQYTEAGEKRRKPCRRSKLS